MESNKKFQVGDLIWAKMRGYPYWPGKLIKPPSTMTSTPKKGHFCVYFFGSDNFSYIHEDNIKVHSGEMIKSFASKKVSPSLRRGIEKIVQENLSAPKKAKSSQIVKKSQKKAPEVSTNRSERKIAKVQKKATPKRRILDDSANQKMSPPRKLSKKSEDSSGLMSNTPPNIGNKSVAVIKPLDDCANSSSGITRREYYEYEPGPSFDLQKPNEAIQAKNIVATEKKIGFIGLGMMGQRLVKNLLTSGHKVVIWNRTTEKCADFVKIGASVAQTPGDVVEKCDIIFCCVSGPDASRSLVFGNCGILSALEKCNAGSKGYVEMSTIDPVTSKQIAEAITQKGGSYLEAPISGSRQMAEDGALLILGAGDRQVFINCESCFFALSKNAYFLSCDVGRGSEMNLILSIVHGVSQTALAEAMALVERCNLSHHNFLEILELAPINSPLLAEKGNSMMRRNFAINTSLKYQQKDLNLALSLGDLVDQPMLLTSAANEIFKRAKRLHYSDLDVSAVYLGAKY